MAKLLLLSTYELGEQPLGIAMPGAMLGAAGHELCATDLAIDGWPPGGSASVDGVVCSVPMHTALRLALAAIDRIRMENPQTPVALIGLYAPVAERIGMLRPGDLASSGIDPTELLTWASRLGPRSLHATTQEGLLPRRDLLPPLDRYAHLEQDGVEVLVGAVEATTGCSHRCKHCPVPLVYNGRSYAVDLDLILGDIGQLVDLGAGHIHFTDPDFLNRPQHARRVAAALAADHPGLSFDMTAKVSHLLRHKKLLPELADAGLTFVISAFESTSDLVLSRLEKGHTSADVGPAVDALREAGIEPRPSLLPFSPWTTRTDLIELLDFVARYDLIWNVDPVQFAIRLLLPPESVLAAFPDPEVRAALIGYDPDELGFTWRHADPLVDDLYRSLADLVEMATAHNLPTDVAYAKIRATVFAALELDDPGMPEVASFGRGDGPSRPRLSESWFCCAEPTKEQFSRLEAAQLPSCEPIAITLGTRRGNKRP
jgi:hypothetical protein